MAVAGAKGRMSSFLNLTVLGLGLLVMAQQSMQMNLINPVAAIDNCKVELTRLGLVLTSDDAERALMDSGHFKPDSERPYEEIAGRKFHIGTVHDLLVIYVNTGGHSMNAAIATQLLFERFRIFGIILLGNAGSLDDSKLKPGFVAVPEFVAFAGAWVWQKFRANEQKGQLIFGNFNYPENGENVLGSVDFDRMPFFSERMKKKDFWLPLSQRWVRDAAEALKDLELRQCHSDVCLPYKPEVAFGLRGSTSDIYVKNKAYAKFLSQKLDASVADQESAAVALGCLSNQKLLIVFRGISNVAGEVDSNPTLRYLASYNAVLAAAKFIESVPTPRIACM